MGRNLIESIMGAVVLAVAGFFLVFAYSHANLGAVKGYEVKTAFTSVGGLPVGSDVRINGIKVGTVTGEHLDPQTYGAVVKLSVSPTVRLPDDTMATIASEGLVGSKYVRLEPGRSDKFIAAGGTITNTKDYKSLEEMVGEIIFLATGSNEAGGADKDKKAQ